MKYRYIFKLKIVLWNGFNFQEYDDNCLDPNMILDTQIARMDYANWRAYSPNIGGESNNCKC